VAFHRTSAGSKRAEGPLTKDPSDCELLKIKNPNLPLARDATPIDYRQFGRGAPRQLILHHESIRSAFGLRAMIEMQGLCIMQQSWSAKRPAMRLCYGDFSYRI